MSTAAALPSVTAASKPLSSWERWGRVLVLPYLLIFAVFVLYPVGYGLWLARHPSSYVKLAEDPIFLRTAMEAATVERDGVEA